LSSSSPHSQGYKELTVSYYQGLLLMLFNNTGATGKLSLAEIVNMTNIEREEVCKILTVFIAGSARLLERVGTDKVRLYHRRIILFIF
jgi:hypothetical protein